MLARGPGLLKCEQGLRQPFIPREGFPENIPDALSRARPRIVLSCIVILVLFWVTFLSGGRRHFCRGGCDIFVARRHWVSLTDIFVGVVFGADIRHAADQRGNVPPISCAVPGVANGHIAQLLQGLHPALDCALRCVVQRAEVGVARVAAARLVGQRGDFCVKNLFGGLQPPIIPHRGGENGEKSRIVHRFCLSKNG